MKKKIDINKYKVTDKSQSLNQHIQNEQEGLILRTPRTDKQNNDEDKIIAFIEKHRLTSLDSQMGLDLSVYMYLYGKDDDEQLAILSEYFILPYTKVEGINWDTFQRLKKEDEAPEFRD